jgi:hypothetical protein
MNSKKLRKKLKKKNKKESKQESQENINIIKKEHQIQREKEKTMMKKTKNIGKNIVKLPKITINQDKNNNKKAKILNNINIKNIGKVMINIKNNQEFPVTNKNMLNTVKIRDTSNKINPSLLDEFLLD